MAAIIRKLKTQERHAVTARGRFSQFGAGFIPDLGLADGETGISFVIPGCGPGPEQRYDFRVAMTDEEWEKLKQQIDSMRRQ